MTVPTILLPVFVQIALMFALAMWMGYERNRALYSKEVHIRDVALTKEGWPSRAKQISNAYHNQYELPVLFFILVAFALITRKADLVFVVLSWVFVAARFLHAFIHTTSNRVPRRFFAYLVSLVTLLIMWIYFAVLILTGI
ncbi:MAG: MAPEG family protein [Xanthobacteraceae bacterium]|nr:MAPEG family protein [Xanthobacteraceae bacterium]QYK45956.1 MAG: MAPEG family protein [Xanthobacteraceae bacterium]HMN51745.1 MAPEG family protein [Xanthobacteraceae bacterium]